MAAETIGKLPCASSTLLPLECALRVINWTGGDLTVVGPPTILGPEFSPLQPESRGITLTTLVPVKTNDPRQTGRPQANRLWRDIRRAERLDRDVI